MSGQYEAMSSLRAAEAASPWHGLRTALDVGTMSFDPSAESSRWDAVEIPGEPGLFIGSLAAAMNLPALNKFKISHILSVMHDWRVNKTKKESFERKFIEVEDSGSYAAQLAGSFRDSGEWVRQALSAGGRVLVHCHAGISRSSTIVCSYLMQNACLSVDDALNQIRRVRPIVMPNSSFFPHLRSLERTLFTQLKESLSERFPQKLVVNLILRLLNIDCRNVGGLEIAIRYGDTFSCSVFELPNYLCVSSDSYAYLTDSFTPIWEPTTVTIEPKAANWCIVRVKELGDNWLLLRETEIIGDFYYALYTLPQLVGNQPSADEADTSIVLPNNEPHRICFTDD